ncbi:uncharacterized protein LOC127865692 isoform X2 [Dreissena polymorpha]|nr:uncharacterized protein LOC127865692 isoform X2 [Dreissena polymorpha]
MTLAIGARRNVEIICNTHSDVVFFNDANINKKVEVQRNNNCKAHGLSNMPNLQCGCNVDFLAACNLSIVKEEYGCYKWNCGSVSNYSHSVDVCLSVEQTSHTMVSTVKCANVQRTPKVEFWTVDERILSSNYDEIRMIKLDQLNISIITALFKQEENRSIVVCKLEENYNTEWSITLILPWTHCVEEQLYKSPSSSTNHTCQTTKGNPVITRQLEEYTDPKCPSVRIHSNVNVTLCDAVNTDDMGARTFVKDKIGSFKLEVINPAIVREFYIDEFRDRVNISLNGGRKVTLICEGDGNPPPTVTLVSKSSIFNTSASPLRYTIEYPSRQDTGEYLCIASNGLGNNSKSIHVEIIIKGEEGSSFITIPICVGSAILIMIVAMCLLRRRCELLKNRRIKERHTVSLEMVTQAHIEPNGVNELTILENPSTNSVHIYETIPPSPIADVSFDAVSDGVDTIVIETMEPTQPCRYESLGQRDVSLYNIIEFL